MFREHKQNYLLWQSNEEERKGRKGSRDWVCVFTVSKTCQIRQCSSRANAHEGSVTKTMIMSSARIERESWVISFALNIIYTNYTFECIHLLFIGQLDRGPELGCRAGTMNNSIDCACCPHMNHLRLEMSVFNTFNTFGAASAWARLRHLVIIVTTTKIKVKPNELRPSQNKQIDRGRIERERGREWAGQRVYPLLI